MSLNYFRIGTSNLLEYKVCQNELHAYKEHLHDELSIGIIERGSTHLKINKNNHYIKTKEAVVIYPFVSHQCQPVDLNNWKFSMIYINEYFYRDMLNRCGKNDFLGIKKLGDDDYLKVKRMIQTIKDNGSLAEKEETIIETLADILNPCDWNSDIVKDERLQEIREYIERNFLEPFKLDDLEKHFGINKYRMIRSFKNKYNVSPLAYQLQLKINYAKHLIRKNQDLIEVALNAGFYDQAHFTKEFRKAYGVTPKQYMKMLK